jgi:hypothetical protein
MAGNKFYVQGSYIDVHDNENVYLSVDKAEVKVSGNGQQTAPKEVDERLKSEAAEEIKEDLVDAGILTDDWQPLGLSGAERALVARAICERLKINEIWQVFGKLWGEKPETLRSYLNKALDQKKSLKFQDRLKNILG